MKKIIPVSDQLLIEPQEREEKTPAGIVLPDTAKEKPQEGIVRALGSGRRYDDEGKKVKVEFEVRVGDRVVYKKWGGNEVKVDGKEMLIVKMDDILAKVEE